MRYVEVAQQENDNARIFRDRFGEKKIIQTIIINHRRVLKGKKLNNDPVDFPKIIAFTRFDMIVLPIWCVYYRLRSTER